MAVVYRNEDTIGRLWNAYWKSNKEFTIRNELVEHYYPLIASFVIRFRRRLPRCVDLDVVQSAAGQGLIEAVERFDPHRCDDFSRYAQVVMRSRVANDLRREYRALSRSCSLQERHLQAEAEALQPLDGPNQEDTRPRVFRPLTESAGPRSLGTMPPDGPDAPTSRAIPQRTLAAETYRGLQPRVKAMLYLCFLEHLSQAEIARIFGISRVRVTQLIREALSHLTD